MEDIRLLRDLLNKCDPKLDYSKYDKKIEKHYLDLLDKEMEEFHYDKNKVIVKRNFKKSEYGTISEYVSSLNRLKKKCNSLVNSNVDLTNLTIPRRFYKGDFLLLDSISNIESLIELLSKFNSTCKIVKKVNLDNDFAILYKGVKINPKSVIIRNKRKYRDMTKEQIAKDSLKYTRQYYINIDHLDRNFAHMEKSKAKNKIYFKGFTSIFKLILLDLLPCILVLYGSSYILNNINVKIPAFEGKWDTGPFVYIILAVVVFAIIVTLEMFLAKSALNKLPLVNSTFAFWPYLACFVINLLYFLSLNQDYTIKGILFSASLILSLADGIFMTFLAGPNFRHTSETNFSLIGRLVIGLTYMDGILILTRCLDTIPMIVALVLFTFATSIGIECKIVFKSPWYSRVTNKKDSKVKEN